jgi:hypothetical protein
MSDDAQHPHRVGMALIAQQIENGGRRKHEWLHFISLDANEHSKQYGYREATYDMKLRSKSSF